MPTKILRHTFASRLAMSGRSIREIACLLGNTFVTAQRYPHLSPEHHRAAIRALDREGWRQGLAPEDEGSAGE